MVDHKRRVNPQQLLYYDTPMFISTVFWKSSIIYPFLQVLAFRNGKLLHVSNRLIQLLTMAAC